MSPDIWLEVSFLKTHQDAKLPTCNNPTPTGDSGYDVYSVEPAIIPAGGSEVVPVGLTVANISPGYWFRIEARSGLGFKHGISPHPGIIDNSYRGDLAIKLYNHSRKDYYVEKGDRIAQLVFYNIIQPTNISFVDSVSQTDRGEGGFGSTGK